MRHLENPDRLLNKDRVWLNMQLHVVLTTLLFPILFGGNVKVLSLTVHRLSIKILTRVIYISLQYNFALGLASAMLLQQYRVWFYILSFVLLTKLFLPLVYVHIIIVTVTGIGNFAPSTAIAMMCTIFLHQSQVWSYLIPLINPDCDYISFSLSCWRNYCSLWFMCI